MAWFVAAVAAVRAGIDHRLFRLQHAQTIGLAIAVALLVALVVRFIHGASNEFIWAPGTFDEPAASAGTSA